MLPEPAVLAEVRKTLERLVPIPDEEWEAACGFLRPHHVPKHGFLIREGERVDKTYYVYRGALRVYYTRGDAEHNRSFVFEGRFFTNSASFRSRLPSHYTVQALEDTTLFYLTYQALQTLYGRHPCWDRLGRLSAERAFVVKEMKEWRFRSLTTDEHYRYLLEEEPRLIERVPQYHLASYLGIAPETLSRIRRRIHRSKPAAPVSPGKKS